MVILKEIGLPHQNFNYRKKEQIEHLFLFSRISIYIRKMFAIIMNEKEHDKSGIRSRIWIILNYILSLNRLAISRRRSRNWSQDLKRAISARHFLV